MENQVKETIFNMWQWNPRLLMRKAFPLEINLSAFDFYQFRSVIFDECHLTDNHLMYLLKTCDFDNMVSLSFPSNLIEFNDVFDCKTTFEKVGLLNFEDNPIDEKGLENLANTLIFPNVKAIFVSGENLKNPQEIVAKSKLSHVQWWF